ncbi:unnamed protein product [Oppiella nova]|uniref:BPTI/Kunitz inhibitor domain-containing protein n=1 Tax=Oppiella nova TaxID=334625 RepID=A0A7R9LIZ4_9ACAR|nr:unnamed protein product [Oppiella nova]CAG2164106.1 unnamed protein product [Oppiella nova]
MRTDCYSAPDEGLCYGHFPRYFCNTTSHKCEPFIYGGCDDNDNRFNTTALCVKSCGDPDAIHSDNHSIDYRIVCYWNSKSYYWASKGQH